MIYNIKTPTIGEYYKCGNGMGVTLTGGSTSTRIFNLTGIPGYTTLTTSNIYACIHEVLTYVSAGTGVTGFSFSYNASTGILTMTSSVAALNANYEFDAEHWVIVIVR